MPNPTPTESLRRVRGMIETIIRESPFHAKCLDAAAALSGLAAVEQRMAELEQEKAEHDASFDLRWKADMRAIKRWQEERPEERKLTWPDHADLCVWLMERVTELEADIDWLAKNEVVQQEVGSHGWRLPHRTFRAAIRAAREGQMTDRERAEAIARKRVTKWYARIAAKGPLAFGEIADQIAAEFAAARAEERERCAKIAEASGEKSKWGSEYELACIQIAERIRAEEESRG